MKVFHCDSCQQLLFFENVVCIRCGHVLAFLPDTLEMAALDPVENDVWRSLAPHSAGSRHRLCANYVNHAVCNWAVPADSPDTLCSSCRLTRVIPDLSRPENHEAWRKLETAKRRLLYSLLNLGLPLQGRQAEAELGLAFEFLSDTAAMHKDPVLTGHDSGVITVNIAEADDAEREKRRLMLHEPYRTLLGHLRHEIGHYYWDVIIQNSDQLPAFRALFGDDRENYAEALQRHYEQGPSPDWRESFISAYASSHPWEDWAETWAHYLHMTDALETAAASGIIIAPPEISQAFSPADIVGGDISSVPFDTLVEHWLPLAYALNNLNRSLGLPDGYPFVLSPAAIEKLRFTHEIIRSLHQPNRTRNQLDLEFAPPV